MGFLYLIFGIVAVTIFGHNLVKLIYPGVTKLESLALGYLIGLGLYTMILFLANLAGLKYAPIETNLLLFVLLLITTLITRKIESPTFTPKINKTTLIPAAIFVIFYLLPVILYGLYWPAKDWDSLALYDYRAISFINTGYMKEAFSTGYDFSYPLFTSIANTWVYSMNYHAPTIIYSLVYLSMLMLFYSLLAKKTPPLYALFWTISLGVISSIYEQAHMTYSNLAYVTYLSFGFIYISEGLNANKGRLVIGMTLVALSTWVRIEPFWLAIIPAILVYAKGIRNKTINTLIYLILVKIVQMPWLEFKSLNNTYAIPSSSGMISDLQILINNLNTSQARIVFDYIWTNIILPDAYLYYALSLSMLLLLLNYRTISVSIKAILFILLTSLLMIFIGTYIFSIRYFYWSQIGHSAQRMSLITIPLILYFLSNIILNTFSLRKIT